MARLKERQELERKRLELDLQKKFLDEQQRLLDATVTQVTGSMKSCGSRRDSIRRVQDWVNRNAEQNIFPVDDGVPAGISSQSVQPVTGVYRETAEKPSHEQQQIETAGDEVLRLQMQLKECQQKIANLQMPSQECRPAVTLQQYTSFEPRAQLLLPGGYEQLQNDYVGFGSGGIYQQRGDPNFLDCGRDEQRQRSQFDTGTDGKQRFDRAPFTMDVTERRHRENAHFGSAGIEAQREIHSRQEPRNPPMQGSTPQQFLLGSRWLVPQALNHNVKYIRAKSRETR